MKIIAVTINAMPGMFQSNVREIHGLLEDVEDYPQKRVVIHPYAFVGSSLFGDANRVDFQRKWLESLRSMDLCGGITLVRHNYQWWVYDIENRNIVDSISLDVEGAVTYADLSITTDTILLSKTFPDTTGKFWIIFILEPYSIEIIEQRKIACMDLSSRTNKPVMLVGALGVSNDLIFSGDIACFIQNNQLFYRFFLKNQVTAVDAGTLEAQWWLDQTQPSVAIYDQSLEYRLIVFAIKDFVHKSGFTKVHLGLSGGIDSALVASLAVQALGKENVVGLLMPSPHSSSHSVQDAVDLAKNLGIHYDIISISEIYEGLQKTLNKYFSLNEIADENIQARIRALYLMAYANSKESFLLTTGNKSEIACGYSTLYGDMCGSYNPIGDLYKTEVYALARFINQDMGYALIPEHIFLKAPSAELRAGQVDQDSLPAYERLDKIIDLLLRSEYTHEEIACRIPTNIEEVEQVATLIHKSEFKRWQSPPVLKLRQTHLGSTRKGSLL